MCSRWASAVTSRPSAINNPTGLATLNKTRVRAAKPRPKAAKDVPTLHARKQNFVRQEFWSAALVLFTEKGFEATTIDEIAEAARVSRRTFFRYFSSKEDLLVKALGPYEDMLLAAVRRHALLSSEPYAMLQRVVLEVAEQIVIAPGARQSMELSHASPAVRGAQLAALFDIQERLEAEYLAACKGIGKDRTKPQLFAAITLSMVNITLSQWLANPDEGVEPIVRHLFRSLDGMSAKPTQ